jgi:SAM-dependent methyltransferase
MDRSDPAYRGQADYTPALLRLYDRTVLGPILPHVWHCPVDRLVDEYREHIRDRHLDVGPGTGYFIDRSGLPDRSRVALLDPNPNVLAHASRRLRRFDVMTVQADVLKALPLERTFASAALSAVLHCLPGPFSRKAQAIANVAAVLEVGGILFGATVLGRDGAHGWLARRFLSGFNRRGAFDNLDDTTEDLRAALEASFERVEIDVVGSVAIFCATGPRGAKPARAETVSAGHS